MTGYTGHLEDDFRDLNPGWDDVRHFVLGVSSPEFSPARATRQLIDGDTFAQLSLGSDDWRKTGSSTTHARPDPADEWPAEFVPDFCHVHPADVMARTANDQDVYNPTLEATSPEEFVAKVQARVFAMAPPVADPLDGAPGLGGLVRYATLHTKSSVVRHNGQLLGSVVFGIGVQPVDDRRGPLGLRAAGPLMMTEIDVKAPGMIHETCPAERARRSIVGVKLPGLRPITPLLRPLADQLSDKLAILACRPGVGDGVLGPRFKDVPDLYYAALTCRVDPEAFWNAYQQNWHWKKAGLDGPPQGYRFYGQAPAGPDELEIRWDHGVSRLHSRSPQLRYYPDVSTMQQTIAGFVDRAAERPESAVHTEMSATLSRALAPGPAITTPRPSMVAQRHLIVWDLDETLSRDDTLHELAKRAGRWDAVEAVHRETQLDYATSIGAKVAALEGVDAAHLDRVVADLVLTDEAEALTAQLRAAGHVQAIVSGGFQPIVEPVARRLGIEEYAAGDLGIKDGRLTGEVGALIDTAGKARIVRKLAAKHNIPPEQIITVGNGSNDVGMFAEAGLAVALNPSPATAEHAHAVVTTLGGPLSSYLRTEHDPANSAVTTPAAPHRTMLGNSPTGRDSRA